MTAPSSTLRQDFAPEPVERVGDPDELVDAREFARIMRWGSYKTVFTALAHQRFVALWKKVQPAAAAAVGTPAAAPKPRPGRAVLRTVAQRLDAVGRDTAPDQVLAVLARDLELAPSLVRDALLTLARPARRSPWKTKDEWAKDGPRQVPEPDDPDGERWRRETVWDYADGRRGPAPDSRPARFDAEQLRAAEQAVLDAVATGVCLDAAGLAELAQIPPGDSAADPLEPARALLTQALYGLRASKRVDLLTRAEIRADRGLNKDQLDGLIKRAGGLEPVLRVNRLTYYRPEDAERALAARP